MQIVLARVDEDFKVVRERRTDLGERPDMERVDKPVAMMWKNDGDAADVEKAKAYAATEGYTVFTYKGERDPLGRAKRDVLRLKRGKSSKKILLPKYNEKHGWLGGDTKRLYAFTDKLTGHVSVHPGRRAGHSHIPVGDNATVRPATRSEAEQYWQNPLHSGWKVEED